MNDSLNVAKIYVVHVSTDKLREKHMQNELSKLNIPFEFMLKGDKSDLSFDVINEYFSGEEMGGVEPTAQQSCTYKHLLIYEKMLIDRVEDALIFEDDVYLFDNFIEIFNLTINELKSLPKSVQDKALINFENSTLQIVHPSDQVDGKHLYESTKSRCAGAYYLNSSLAQAITKERMEKKCHKIIDWYHNELVNSIGLQNYWCHPPIVEQGSHNGRIQSLLDDRKEGTALQLKWKISRFYKHKIRPLLGRKSK